MQFASTYTANNSFDDMLNFGAEYDYMDIFFLRGGYNFMVENSSQNTFGFTAGAGLNYEIGSGVNMSFDYAFREVKEFPTANHIFTVKLLMQ